MLCCAAGLSCQSIFWSEELSHLSFLLCASIIRAGKCSTGAQVYQVVLGKELKLMERAEMQIR